MCRLSPSVIALRSGRTFRDCVSYSSASVTKCLTNKTWGKKCLFCLTMIECRPLWQGGHSDKNMKQLVTLRPVQKQRDNSWYSNHFLLFILYTLIASNLLTHGSKQKCDCYVHQIVHRIMLSMLWWVFLPQNNLSLETFSWTCAEVYLPGDSWSCCVDNQCRSLYGWSLEKED